VVHRHTKTKPKTHSGQEILLDDAAAADDDDDGNITSMGWSRRSKIKGRSEIFQDQKDVKGRLFLLLVLLTFFLHNSSSVVDALVPTVLLLRRRGAKITNYNNSNIKRPTFCRLDSSVSDTNEERKRRDDDRNTNTLTSQYTIRSCDYSGEWPRKNYSTGKTKQRRFFCCYFLTITYGICIYIFFKPHTQNWHTLPI
jgi:hypothetical protein